MADASSENISSRCVPARQSMRLGDDGWRKKTDYLCDVLARSAERDSNRLRPIPPPQYSAFPTADHRHHQHRDSIYAGNMPTAFDRAPLPSTGIASTNITTITAVGRKVSFVIPGEVSTVMLPNTPTPPLPLRSMLSTPPTVVDPPSRMPFLPLAHPIIRPSIAKFDEKQRQIAVSPPEKKSVAVEAPKPFKAPAIMPEIAWPNVQQIKLNVPPVVRQQSAVESPPVIVLERASSAVGIPASIQRRRQEMLAPATTRKPTGPKRPDLDMPFSPLDFTGRMIWRDLSTRLEEMQGDRINEYFVDGTFNFHGFLYDLYLWTLMPNADALVVQHYYPEIDGNIWDDLNTMVTIRKDAIPDVLGPVARLTPERRASLYEATGECKTDVFRRPTPCNDIIGEAAVSESADLSVAADVISIVSANPRSAVGVLASHAVVPKQIDGVQLSDAGNNNDVATKTETSSASVLDTEEKSTQTDFPPPARFFDDASENDDNSDDVKNPVDADATNSDDDTGSRDNNDADENSFSDDVVAGNSDEIMPSAANSETPTADSVRLAESWCSKPIFMPPIEQQMPQTRDAVDAVSDGDSDGTDIMPLDVDDGRDWSFGVSFPINDDRDESIAAGVNDTDTEQYRDAERVLKLPTGSSAESYADVAILPSDFLQFSQSFCSSVSDDVAYNADERRLPDCVLSTSERLNGDSPSTDADQRPTQRDDSQSDDMESPPRLRLPADNELVEQMLTDAGLSIADGSDGWYTFFIQFVNDVCFR